MRNMPGEALLIIAHPGHELLVHGWLERSRAQVCVLTDGSGGQAAPRLDATLKVILAAGAAPGPVFGVAPDKAFYQAILAQDVPFFASLVARLARVIADRRPRLVLSDAVEHFNPVHDLASVIATLAVRRALPANPRRFEFPIERPVDIARPAPQWRVRKLTPSAFRRKLAAAAGNAALSVELARVRAEQPGVGECEVLMPIAADRPLLPRPTEEPYYETFGRARVAAGLYADLITYDDHMAPLVAALAAAVEAPLAALSAP